uniref:tetratricopeptide repeat protein n=1 Tax=Frankia sp. Cr1 TaxID=3073931 RepID=UPI002AD250D6
QCEALGDLSFLPTLAQELYAAFTDPLVGGCGSALGDQPGLVLNPTLSDMAARVMTAFRFAHDNGSALFLAFVGHGQVGFDGSTATGLSDFYLLPYDCADPDRPSTDNAWLVGQRLRELLRDHDQIDGLVVLLDACHSGQAAVEVAHGVASVAMAAGSRFDLLTATDDRPAADGCFTRALTELLHAGHAGRGAWIGCQDAHDLITCRGQSPQRSTFDGHRVTDEGDPGLWLAPNRQRAPGRIPPPGDPAGAMADDLTTGLETPRMVEGLLARASRARWLAVVGPAGSGKSTLLSALARPELTRATVPDRFLHALVYLDRTTTLYSLTDALHKNLDHSVPGFRMAVAAYRDSQPADTLDQQPPLVHDVTGPLRHLPGDEIIRLGVDGLDQLDDTTGDGVVAALVAMAEDPDLPRLRLIVTSREPGPAVTGGQQFTVDTAAPASLARYLQRRCVPPAAADTLADLCARGASAWLLARLIADTYAALTQTERDTLLERLHLGDSRTELLAGLFDRIIDQACIDQAGAYDATEWTANLLPVLTPLTAAGAGPVIPIDLLAGASGWLDGPDRPKDVRDVLARLGRLVVRSQPGTAGELVGLFHPALVDHLSRHTRRPLDPAAGRRILLNEVEKLAPITGIYADNPLYRWAAGSEAEYLWQNGQISAALRALRRRPLPTPRANLTRWTEWYPRIRTARGPDHPNTLTTRGNIADWTGETGDPGEALRLFRELLPDQERVLGPGHPDTLTTRNNIAHWTGQAGDPGGGER